MVPCRQKANTRAFKRKNCPNQLPTPHQCTQRPPTSKSCTKQIQQGFFPHRATKRIPSLSYLLHFTLGVCGGEYKAKPTERLQRCQKEKKKKKKTPGTVTFARHMLSHKDYYLCRDRRALMFDVLRGSH